MQAPTLAPGQRVLDRTSIRQFVAGNNALFNQRMQTILHSDLSQIQSLQVFEKTNNPTPNLFYFHADRYNEEQHQSIELLITKQIDHFHNNSDQTYAIAYVHSSFVDFLAFRRILERWPEHFFHRLRRIYIVGASIMVKIIEVFSVGTFYRLCDEIFLNLRGIQQLEQIDTTLMKALGEDPKCTAPVYKNSIKIVQNEIYGKTIDDYVPIQHIQDLYSGKYPVLLLQLLARLVHNPEQLRLQGVFRKNCDYDQLQKLQKQVSHKNMQSISQQKDILVVSGMLKKVLNNLKLPLFNYNIYQKVIAFQGGSQQQLVTDVYTMMQYINQKVFVLLLTFLQEYVVAQVESNRMSAYNLSVVFAPCFFRPKEYDLKDLIYSGKFAKVLIHFFEMGESVIPQSERKLASRILEQLAKGAIQL